MIIRIILFFILFFNAFASTQKELQKTAHTIKYMNSKLSLLAKDIIKTEKKLSKINQKIKTLNQKIEKLKQSLKNSEKFLNTLINKKGTFLKEEEKINKEITNFIAQNYYLDSKKVSTLNDLIYTTLTEKILEEYSKHIEELIRKNENIKQNIEEINKKIEKINLKKEELEKIKKRLVNLKARQLKILKNLKKQKNIYRAKLKEMLKKQKRLQQKLAELKIIKHQKSINVEIPTQPIEVKKVGNAYIRPKVTKYSGVKTIPPVRGKIIKKFGSYIDPIYKIRIYNDSITIKTKPNALVRAIFPGKVIYIGEEGGKKIIFIKHKNNLFSVYANLYKISPLIKKGSYVKKGQVIARVKDSLEFEVTYKDKAINPLQVINLK